MRARAVQFRERGADVLFLEPRPLPMLTLRPRMRLFPCRLLWLSGGLFTLIYGLVYAASKSSPDAQNILHKFNIWIHGVMHLVFTNETSWKPEKQPDPERLGQCQGVTRKTVIFIRHGESKWNEV